MDKYEKNKWYAKAYQIMLEEEIRKDHIANKFHTVTNISDDDRQMKNKALDMLIEAEGNKYIESCKSDAVFAVNFIRSCHTSFEIT